MRVVILNTSDISGGAARAAYRLHKGLRLDEHESFMLVKNKQSDDENVLPVRLNDPMRNCNVSSLIQSDSINRNRTQISNTRFSFPYPGIDLSKLHVIREADVINVHWVASFQSVETISGLLEIDKPVVWTLHDMWPFTGGCHYPAGCEKYIVACSDCPQLRSNKYQIPLHVLKNKLRRIKGNLTIVSPSKWLADCAGRSRLFKHLRIEVIPNSIETDIFRPFSKDQAKKNLGIDTQSLVLLFGAPSPSLRRKGFAELLNAVQVCLNNVKFAELVRYHKVTILVFGEPQNHLKEIGIPIISAGVINDDKKLAELYSAADIFILPSLEDNLPNTMLESMACGTPVVAFAIGGIPDVVVDEENGCLAGPGDEKQLAEKILSLAFDEDKRKKMAQKCRELTENNFTLSVQARRYVELFSELLREKDLVGQRLSTGLHLPPEGILTDSADEEIHPYFLRVYKRLLVKKKLRRLLSLMPRPFRIQ